MKQDKKIEFQERQCKKMNTKKFKIQEKQWMINEKPMAFQT
jgi:hypothetical protein